MCRTAVTELHPFSIRLFRSLLVSPLVEQEPQVVCRTAVTEFGTLSPCVLRPVDETTSVGSEPNINEGAICPFMILDG